MNVAGGPASPGEVVHAAARGTIAAMAMSGMRTVTGELDLVEETPPEAIFRQRLPRLLRRAPRDRRRRVIEFAHWGAVGGVGFALLPEGVRRRAWAGPIYGLLLWISFEAGIAPLLGLRQARRQRLVERAAFAADHLLYGLVLSEIRRRPQG
ncbi:MAG TPA: hypothetical protein VGO48_10805 [Conexibacter sp.]|jgi:hypothetical protein|nr:hypothetical protein [Conexibacter sp.]